VVNFVGQGRVEVAQGVVGQPGQVNDGLKAFQIGRFDISNVFFNINNALGGQVTAEGGIALEVGVYTGDVMPGFQQ
jgi:hypothetical protein